MTTDIMFGVMSKFFGDVKNKVFTSADGNPWWSVHAFTGEIFVDNKGHSRSTWSIILKGHFGDEIKKFTKYVRVGETVILELFETGGAGFTPVMTIVGLQKLLMRLPKNAISTKLRDIADQTLALWIAGDETFIEGARANAASSAPIPQLYREAIASERAAGGPSIAAPSDQVLAARMACFCCT